MGSSRHQGHLAITKLDGKVVRADESGEYQNFSEFVEQIVDSVLEEFAGQGLPIQFEFLPNAI